MYIVYEGVIIRYYSVKYGGVGNLFCSFFLFFFFWWVFLVFLFSFFFLFYFILFYFYCNGRDGTFKSRCTSKCWGGRSSVKTLVISFSYQYFKRGVEKIAVYLFC